MRQRMSRSHKSRRDFKIDGILNKVMAAKMKDPMPQTAMADFMTLTFLGFYDKTGNIIMLFYLILKQQLT